MVKCFSVADVKSAVYENQMALVDEGFFDMDDAKAFVRGFDFEIDKFYREHNVSRLFLFVEDEIEDEEFGMVEIDGQWNMMYMSARYDQVHFSLE